jgi:hypothetical protein
VAVLVKSLCAQGDAEDPPEVAADWFAQADDYAQKVHRLDLAVRIATAGLGIAGGDTAAALGRHPEELEAFERAVELEPGNGEALLGKGRALVALEGTGEAREWLEGFAGRSDCEPERSQMAAVLADAATPRAIGSRPTTCSPA